MSSDVPHHVCCNKQSDSHEMSFYLYSIIYFIFYGVNKQRNNISQLHYGSHVICTLASPKVVHKDRSPKSTSIMTIVLKQVARDYMAENQINVMGCVAEKRLRLQSAYHTIP